MEKPYYKLVGSPCGQQGQYSFYKALRIFNGKQEQVLTIGDCFFVRIWQDSELISIGELQLLWTDRVSDQTLVSLRLYFLPENTPDGRHAGIHGEDEVLALNEKVVLRADDLLSWICSGGGWRCGLRAVWRGACAPPASATQERRPETAQYEPDPNSPGVVVFSYPRYCRYRAALARLEGVQAAWLRHSLVAALGGYAAHTNNTTILYCRDTFEYPELEGHEFVCNHLAPRLKGRPRGRRRRHPRSRSHSASSASPPASPSAPGPGDSDGEAPATPHTHQQKISPRRLSLRNGSTEKVGLEEESRHSAEDRTFLQQLRQHCAGQGPPPAIAARASNDLSLRAVYSVVKSLGGFEAVCRDKLWRKVHAQRPTKARAIYLRYLRPYENGRIKPNGKIDEEIVTIHVPDSPRRGNSPRADSSTVKEEKSESAATPTAEELNRQFLESITPRPGDSRPLVSVRPPQLLIDPDKQKKSVMKLFAESGGLLAELTRKYNVKDETVIEEVGEGKLSDGSCMLLSELAQKLQLGAAESALVKQLGAGSRGSLAAVLNGHKDNPDQRDRPLGRSSLRAVRVKPARPHAATATQGGSAPAALRPSSSGSAGAPVTNFGIHHPPAPTPAAPAPATATATATHSDDEIVEVMDTQREVPYKPKTPEIIDLDEYPESPQSTKKKKLDILKERGLEVTAIPPAWGGVGAPPQPAPPPPLPPLMLNPAMQHQIMTQASLFQMYNIVPQNYANGIQPPKVIQSSCLYGTPTPEKTVYGNPKDPFMPPPHVLHGTPIKAQRTVTTEKVESIPTRQDILDLTCKTQKPSVEIVRIPTASPSKSAVQNLTKNYTLLDGKAVVGSNLEITLVNPKCQTPPKNRQPQKRSSNGKFMSSKTPTPPKDFSKEYPKNFPSPSGVKSSPKKPNPINIPTYQISKEEVSPTSSTSSRDSQQNLLQNVFKNQTSLAQIMEMQKTQSFSPNLGSIGQNLTQMMDLQKSVPLSPFVDPMYMSALYSSLAGQMDQRQLAMYRDLMASQFRYSGLLGGVATPTTKN